MEEKKTNIILIGVIVAIVFLVGGLVGGFFIGKTISLHKEADNLVSKGLDLFDKTLDKATEEINKQTGIDEGIIVTNTEDPVIIYYNTNYNSKGANTVRYIITNKEAINKVNALLNNKTKSDCSGDDNCSGVGHGNEVYVINYGSNADSIYQADSKQIVYNNEFYDLSGSNTVTAILNEYIK